jgi:L-lactate dehydrogenase complex protein LldF
MKAAGWAFGSAARTAGLERLAGLGARALSGVRRRAPGGRRVLGALPGPARGWSDARDVPLPAPESFRAWWKRTGGGAR